MAGIQRGPCTIQSGAACFPREPAFPEPAIAVSSRAEVFLGYLEYFRSRLVSKLEALPSEELRRSRLSSGWTPIELLKHVAHDELRWLEWRFEGRPVADPWGEGRDGRWYVAADETLEELVAALHTQAARSSGSCSTWSRSTPARSATSTSSASSPTARSESKGPGWRPGGRRLTARSGTDECRYRAVSFDAGTRSVPRRPLHLAH